jgi:hypothetical protein
MILRPANPVSRSCQNAMRSPSPSFQQR